MTEITKEYFAMQRLCRETIGYIRSVVCPGMDLRELKDLCEEYMLNHGADSFWWCGVGAFLFSGDETAVSVVPESGYIPSDKRIQENDIITIDLSPQKDGVWGDFARTLVLEDGKLVQDTKDIKNEEWRNGMRTGFTPRRAIRQSSHPCPCSPLSPTSVCRGQSMDLKKRISTILKTED